MQYREASLSATPTGFSLAIFRKNTGKVLAYVFGRRQDNVFRRLQVLLEPFGIIRFYTDGQGAYERHIAPEQHAVGTHPAQNIESKHVNLRTRIKHLVRQTICFRRPSVCTSDPRTVCQAR